MRSARPNSKLLEETRGQPASLRLKLKDAAPREMRLQRRFAVLAARGASDNAAPFGRYLIEITARIPITRTQRSCS
jgi:glucosamine--fructose-6-phosphate aminotransferase (isomerizing)